MARRGIHTHLGHTMVRSEVDKAVTAGGEFRADLMVTFKVELICIADAADHRTLVYRTPTRNIMLPSSRLFHCAKRAFEQRYLQHYR